MNPSGTTNLICLLGHPVAHSISPAMHNTAFDNLGLDYSYMAFDVEKDDLENAVKGLKAINCYNFNLTMPLKSAVIPFLDEIDEIAELAHSVNTCVCHEGKLKGYTTDGIGFLRSMLDSGITYIGKTITILGAGGAASSIITQAAMEGVDKINIFKRNNSSFYSTVDFADRLSKKTSCDVSVYDMADMNILKVCLEQSDILINSTNVGMGNDNTSLVPKEFLTPSITVCDVIYHPAETKLLKDAKSLDCMTMNGKYMLLYQGAAAFKLWTGLDMPVDLVKAKCFDV